jgi:hypothetical protein
VVWSLGKLRFSEQRRDVENSWHNLDKLGFMVSSLPRLEETWLIEQLEKFVTCVFVCLRTLQ